MPPRKIVFIAPTGQLGGAERCLVDTIWSLRQNMPTAQLQLIVGSQGPLVQACFNAGLNACQFIPLPQRVRRLGDSGLSRSVIGKISFLFQVLICIPSLCIYLVRLRKLVIQLKPDLVHVLGLKMQLLSLVVVPRRIPVVWNIQDYIGQRRLIRHLFRIFLILFGRHRKIAAGCCSNSVSRDFAHVLGQHRFKSISTIYNTVDLETYTKDGETHPDIASHPAQKKIGLVATYARWKGHDIFIKALAELAQKENLFTWHAFIVGGPIYDTVGSQWSLAELQEMAQSLDISDRITFIPFQPDAAAVMRSLDIVVHCSTKPEPFGRVIAEAQACGSVVVAVGSGGSGEVIVYENNNLTNQQINGLKVQMNNAEDLAEKLSWLLAPHMFLIETFRWTGPTLVSQRFNRKNLALEWLAVYDTLDQPTAQNHLILKP